MENPTVLNNFLEGKEVIKTTVTIDNQSLINLYVGCLLMLVLAFFAYKIILKK